MTHSLVPENWQLIDRYNDEETGQETVLIGREKRDFTSRLTVWKLVDFDGEWRSVAQWISKGQWRIFSERRGVRLSDSVLDRQLLHLALNA